MGEEAVEDLKESGSNLHAMVVMSKAIRGAAAECGVTKLSEMRLDILKGFSEMIDAFAADLRGELRRRGE